MNTLGDTHRGHNQPTLDVREHEINLVVHGCEIGADGVLVLILSDADGYPLPEWTRGAHIDRSLDDQLTGQYSLSGDPADLLNAIETRCRGWPEGITARRTVRRQTPGRAGPALVIRGRTAGQRTDPGGPCRQGRRVRRHPGAVLGAA